jgi:Cdc6-like AAA superfamily ATPase
MAANQNNSYLEYINCMTNANMLKYIGPKALFDTNFIPPTFVAREKQANLLQGVVMDAIEDKYATNVNLYGLKGVGKNLMIRHFLQWLKKSQISEEENESNEEFNSKSSKSNNPQKKLCIVQVNCEQKEIDQIFIQILMELIKHMEFKIDLQNLIKCNSTKLWNLFKVLMQKIKSPVLIYMQQSEFLDANYLSKLYSFAKNNHNLQIITSINTGSQRYNFRQYEGIDHRIRLDTYENSELKQITQDRSIMSFKKGLDSEAQDMVVDYVTDFDLKVPGSCINYLREVFPVIQQNGDILPENLRNISQYYFDGISLDALTMADFVMGTTIEDRLFLEYLVNFFRQVNNYYIPFTEIKKAYLMTGEELGFKYQKKEFLDSLKKITEAQIIRPSLYYLSKLEGKMTNGVFIIPHYLTLPIEEVNEIMNFSFGVEDPFDSSDPSQYF